jgi:Zn-dependent protease with chaperone function
MFLNFNWRSFLPFSLIFNFFLIAFSSSGQQSYRCMVREFPGKDSLAKVLTSCNDDAIKAAPTQFTKEFKTAYDARLKMILSQMNEGMYIYDEVLYHYLQAIIDNLQSSNPIIKNLKIRFFVTCYPWPNASSLGDGTILINIGLLQKVTDDGQLAFVLGHEIAHYYLKHSEQSLLKHLTVTNSAEFKKKLNEISKSEYSAYHKSKNLLKEYIYDERKHSRDHEFNADSMSFELLKNSKYSLEASVSCINLLDTIDHYKFKSKINYSKILGTEEYPFRGRWLEIESSLFHPNLNEGDFFSSDSIKTHPDCSKRSEKLQKNIQVQNEKKIFIADSATWFRLKERADFEFVAGWNYVKDYGSGLFYTLKHLNQQPDNPYLNVTAGTLLRLIHNAETNHEISQFVQRPSNAYEMEYNELLELIDNLRFSELTNIGYFYHKSRFAFYQEDEDFLFNFLYFTKEMQKAEEITPLKQLYIKQFPNGKYIQQLNLF